MSKILHETYEKNYIISHIEQPIPNDMPHAQIHTEYELYYLVKGERYYFIEDAIYLITPGNLVLVSSGTVHRTACVRPNTSHERILLIFNGDFIQPALSKLDIPPLPDLFRTPVIQFDPSAQEMLRSLLQGIITEQTLMQAGYHVAIKLKILELLFLISRRNAFPTSSIASTGLISEKHKKVNEATFYIKEHFMEPLSLQTIADSIFVSRGYLSNIFNETTGMKLTDYINIQRINYAKTLLCSSDANITDIAASCGYESITYFERIFKQLTGVSPLRFKQMQKN